MTSSNDHVHAFLTAISIIGTFGNLIVAFVYWQKKDKQTSTFFILVLSFIDLTVCCILVPMTIYMENILFETDNLIVCKTFFFLTTTTVPSSTLLMTAIAFDRFFCICMVNRNIMTYPKAKILGFSLMVFSSFLGVIPALAAVAQINSKNSYFQNITEDSSFYAMPPNTTINNNNNNNINHTGYSGTQCFLDMDSRYSIFGFLIMPFKIFYDCIFVASVITITILYILIYKEIYTRRKAKRDNKRKLLLNSLMNGGGKTNKVNKENQNNEQDQNDDRNKSFLYRILFCFGNMRIKTDDKPASKNLITNKNEQIKKLNIPLIKITKDSQAENENDDHNEDENEKALFEKSDEQSEKLMKNPRKISLQDSEKSETEKSKSSNKASGVGIRKQPSILRRRSLSHGKHVISTKDIRTAFMLFVVSFLFIVFYLPSITATYLSLFIPNLSSNLYMSYLYFSNSAINPIIYCFLNPNFRTDLLKLFFKRGFIFDKCAKHASFK